MPWRGGRGVRSLTTSPAPAVPALTPNRPPLSRHRLAVFTKSTYSARRLSQRLSFLGGRSAFVSRIYSDIFTSRPPVDRTGHRTKFDIRDVNFWYPGKQALFDISITIPEQTVVAFIGPSG